MMDIAFSRLVFAGPFDVYWFIGEHIVLAVAIAIFLFIRYDQRRKKLVTKYTIVEV